jgi:hypothetical protein
MTPFPGLAAIIKNVEPGSVATILRLLRDMPTAIEVHNILHQRRYADGTYGCEVLHFTIGTDIAHSDRAGLEHLFCKCMMTATPLLELFCVAITTGFRTHTWEWAVVWVIEIKGAENDDPSNEAKAKEKNDGRCTHGE